MLCDTYYREQKFQGMKVGGYESSSYVQNIVYDDIIIHVVI